MTSAEKREFQRRGPQEAGHYYARQTLAAVRLLVSEGMAWEEAMALVERSIETWLLANGYSAGELLSADLQRGSAR